ncbi:MAG TPA: hypothetical protein VNT79_02320 [Phycisphaerae bacterium]|nr:hypothetical protein [Phycisphaerae bacterium]
MARLLGAACGLLVFAAMILRGLMADNPVDVILLRALAGLFGSLFLGTAAGWIAERILNDQIVTNSQNHDGAAPATASTQDSSSN